MSIGLEIDLGGLDGVIEDLERVRDGLPRAIGRAMDPKLWLPEARRAAFEVLQFVAEGEAELQFVPEFVKRVSTAFWGNGIQWTLDEVRVGALNVLEAMRMEQMGPLLQFANIDEAHRLEELVLEWVRSGTKLRDERDTRKTDEEIASHLLRVLMLPSRSPEHADKKQGLAKHLQAFALERFGEGGLSAERSGVWLHAVLEAWIALATEEVPERLLREIRHLWQGKAK